MDWLPQSIRPSIVLHPLRIFRHVDLMKEGEEIFLDGLLNGTEGVATSADTGGRRGKVEEGSQPLDLNVDSGGTPERRVVVEVGLKNPVDMRGV